MIFTITEDGSCPMDAESYSYDSVFCVGMRRPIKSNRKENINE